MARIEVPEGGDSSRRMTVLIRGGWVLAPEPIADGAVVIEDGTILEAKIVPPTSQNLRHMERDLAMFLPDKLHLPDDELARLAATTFVGDRNYLFDNITGQQGSYAYADPNFNTAHHALRRVEEPGAA